MLINVMVGHLLQRTHFKMSLRSAGKSFRELVAHSNKPVQVLGAINAYSALLATHVGAKALYLSGSGVATASYGLPDLGVTNIDNVAEDARRITGAVPNTPLLVDIDTGFGSCFSIQRAIREMERAGVAAVHIEDQVAEKRCGHRPGKQLVDTQEMVDRLLAAVEARVDADFVIMARTDALSGANSCHDLDNALRRAEAFLGAGADMLFLESVTELQHFKAFKDEFPAVPLLANITEFGNTPLWSTDELDEVGVDLALYPLSAHRAMARAAEKVYCSILRDGHQRNVVKDMQTREELYKALDYFKFEATLDKLLNR